MNRPYLGFLTLLISLQITLFADWTKSLGTMQKSQSVKKSYLVGMLNQQSYNSYKIDRLRSENLVKTLYKDSENTLQWFEDDGSIGANVALMVDAINLSSSEGLDPNRYHLNDIESLLKSISDSIMLDDREYNLASVKLDILLSDAFFTLLRELANGEVDYIKFRDILNANSHKEDIDYRWEATLKEIDYLTLFHQLKLSGDYSKVIYSYAPNNSIYNNLKRVYLKYKNIQDLGGFEKIKSGKNLKVGSVSDRVVELRTRLYQSGDLEFFDQENREFDSILKEALKKFQKRVGIWPSGILNSRTLKELNSPISKKIGLIKLNLERARWEGDSLSPKYIFVNIPEFNVRFIQDDMTLLKSRVIVGKPKNPTPIFKADMSYIVLNPRWSVPNSIVAKELLSKIQEDPYYLEDRNYKVYSSWSRSRKVIDSFDIDWFEYDKESKIPFNLVQEPGSGNPLGNVKFMFPNDYAVYIHDTPTKNLFKKPVRAFSHGCIRLHKPQKLLEFISKEYLGSDYKSIKAKLDTGKNHSIGLTKKIPVYVRYYTVYIDETGGAVFSKDIYKYDQIQQRLLQKNK